MPDDVRETYEQILAVARIAACLDLDRCQAVVAEFGRMHALMPIVDPTGYRRLRATMPDHERLANAFLTFRLALVNLVVTDPGARVAPLGDLARDDLAELAAARAVVTIARVFAGGADPDPGTPKARLRDALVAYDQAAREAEAPDGDL